MADLEGAKRLVMSYKGPKIRIMEVCGTHTHEIFRLGIRKLLSPYMELVSGPGCPVCVTPVGWPKKEGLRSVPSETYCEFPGQARR